VLSGARDGLLATYEPERIGFARRLVATTDRGFTLVTKQGVVARWVRTHAATLNRLPTAFLSVCLAVLEKSDKTKRELAGIIARFFARTGWRPPIAKPIAGAVLYTRYGWLKRVMMKRIVSKAGGGTDTTRDYEYTDWNDLRVFAEGFARQLTTSDAMTGATIT